MARLGNSVAVTRRRGGSTTGFDRSPGATGEFEYDPVGFNGPPPGTYSPTIEAEVLRTRHELQANLEKEARKQGWSKQEVEQKLRDNDRTLRQSLGDTNRNLGYNEADARTRLGYAQTDLGNRLGQLGINFARDIQDLSTAKIRGQEDYTRTLTNLQHEYGSKAEQQTQTAIQQGTDEAGTSTASSAVRGANQAFDKGNVDLSHNRSEADLATRQERDTQDYGTNVRLAEEGYGRQVAGINTDLGRTQTQAGITNRRAEATHNETQATTQHAYSHTLKEYATAASEAKARQAEYETNAGTSAYYEAHQLHPGIKFPGSTDPNTPTQGPHAYAVGPAAPARAPKGINIGRSVRLTPPRY
jgi:hypothetical protein